METLLDASRVSILRQSNPVLDEQARTVNSLLASLRNNQDTHHDAIEGIASATQVPSMPPTIQQILHPPDAHAPRPTVLPRSGPEGRRLPPGPRPPPSWVSSLQGRNRGLAPAGDGSVLAQAQMSPLVSGFRLSSTSGAGAGTETGDCDHGDIDVLFPRLPGAPRLASKSLLSVALRKMAHTWPFQKSLNRYYLYGLPGSLRSALLATLCRHHTGGVTPDDLRTLLQVPRLPGVLEANSEATAIDSEEASLNDDFCHLDLSGCLGRTISLKELSTFLFGCSQDSSEAGHSNSRQTPATVNAEGKILRLSEEVHESWETYSSSSPSPSTPMNHALPYLTHLSLALTPETQVMQEASNPAVLWKQLLFLAAKLPTLTHLSLANWPVPRLSNRYSLALPFLDSSDDTPTQNVDLAEAIFVMKRLSRSLYGLQYLDVSGCSQWWEVLRYSIEPVPRDMDLQFVAPPGLGVVSSDGTTPAVRESGTGVGADEVEVNGPTGLSLREEIDWVGDWGKVETVVMQSGLPEPVSSEALLRWNRAYASPRELERHVRSQRRGRNRCFNVEGGPKPTWCTEATARTTLA